MKKAICILAVMICCICSTARTEAHIVILGTVASDNDHRTLTFDLTRTDDNSTLVSSTLAPDYAILFHNEYSNIYNITGMLCELKPESIFLFVSKFNELYQEWLQTRYPEKHTGCFSGNLFPRTVSVSQTEYMLWDLTQYIKNKCHFDTESEEKKSDNGTADLLFECFTCMADAMAVKYNPLVRVKSYDDGRFITVDLIQQEQVIMTVSMDNTTVNEKRILITYKENNRYYYRDIHTRIDADEFTVLSYLYGSGESLYEYISYEDLLIAERFTLTGNDTPCRMSYDCENGKEEKVLSLTGSLLSDRLDASIYFPGSIGSDIRITVSLNTEKTDTKPDEKKVLNYNNESESNEYRIAFICGLSAFLEEVTPMLPVSSQKLLYQILFNQ